MSKSIDILRSVFLVDPSTGETARIIGVEGSESGYDHLRVYTQSPSQRDENIATVSRIYSEEVDLTDLEERTNG